MSIRFHRKGAILYFAALAACLTFSTYYGGPASFAWLYAVLLLPPLSVLYILLNYRFLRVFQEAEVHKLVRGEDHRFRAKIENASPLPIHNMQLRTWTDRCNLYEIEDGTAISLGSHESTELRSSVSCKYAGSYDIGIRSAAFTDPFAIFTITLDIPYTFRAVVSPPVTDIADTVLDLENQRNSTGLKSNRLTEETPGSDLRPYERGDSLGDINWKVSARLSTLVTRIPDKMEKRTVTILMKAVYDPKRKWDLDQLQKRDYFLEFIVSAAWHFAKQGVPVRLIYPAGPVSESTVDSYETFMDFYGLVADGLFYYSEQDFNNLAQLAGNRRNPDHDQGTWILIREDPGPGADQCTICD